MKDIKSVLVAKSLISERDEYFKDVNIDLYSQIIACNINIFTSTYFLSINNENETVDYNDTKFLYRKYFATRFSATRFLLELFLSTLDYFAKTTLVEKNYYAHSLDLSEKILEHKDDLSILMLSPNNPDFSEKIKDNKKRYVAFLDKYGKVSPLVQDSLESYFITTQADPLRRRNPKNGGRTFESEYGFTFFRDGKQKYGNIIEQSAKLNDLFTNAHTEGLIDSNVDRSILKIMYSLFSKEAHPTISSVVDFERYISSASKKELIKSKIEENETFLKIIGMLMDILCKTERGANLTGIKLRYKDKSHNTPSVF